MWIEENGCATEQKIWPLGQLNRGGDKWRFRRVRIDMIWLLDVQDDSKGDVATCLDSGCRPSGGYRNLWFLKRGRLCDERHVRH